MADEEAVGTLIRTADGKVYFLTEEALAGCEVTDDSTRSEASEAIEGYGEVSGFSFRPGFEIAYASVPKTSINQSFRGVKFNLLPDVSPQLIDAVVVW